MTGNRFSAKAKARHRANASKHAEPRTKAEGMRFSPRRSRSKYGYDVVGEREGPEFPNVGPGNRKIPMTMPKFNLPPCEEDDE